MKQLLKQYDITHIAMQWDLTLDLIQHQHDTIRCIDRTHLQLTWDLAERLQENWSLPAV